MTHPTDNLVALTPEQHDIAQKAADTFHTHPPLTLYEAVQDATGWERITEENKPEFNLLFLAAQLKAQET